MPTVKKSGCCMGGVHWSTSIVNPNHRIVCRTGTVIASFFALDPCPDVRRTVAKRCSVAFARAQESNSASVHENDILEIQHEGEFRLALPETEDFLKADLRRDPTAELALAEGDMK